MAVPIRLPLYPNQASVTAKGYSEAGSLLQSSIALTESAVPGLYTGSLAFATFPVGYYDMRVYIGSATVASASWAIAVTADGTTADYADSIGELKSRAAVLARGQVIGEPYTWTNQAGDTHTVTIDEAP